MTVLVADGRHDLAQRLLVAAYGANIRVAGAERIGTWSVERLYLSGEASKRPDSVLLKWFREDPNGFRTGPGQVGTERAALEFLEERGIGVAPRLISADPDARLLTLEDITPSVTLADVLAAAGPDGSIAAGGLVSFALGSLHGRRAKGRRTTSAGVGTDRSTPMPTGKAGSQGAGGRQSTMSPSCSA